MILSIQPASKLSGTIGLPASKSYSIRAFIIAACGGSSRIINPSDCDDAKVACRMAQALGSQVVSTKVSGRDGLNDSVWDIMACHKSSRLTNINVKESGTTLRFILPLVGVHTTASTIDGEGTLEGRPNLFLTETLRAMGLNIKGQGNQESIPIVVDGGRLKGGAISIDGSISSQFISALLITCPQLAEDSVVRLKGQKIVSTDYITMTTLMLAKAGVKVEQKTQRHFVINGNQKFKGLRNYHVPSDYGLAAFLMAASVLVDSDVTLRGHLSDDIQADGHILPLMTKMGAVFKKTSRSIKIKGPQSLKGGRFSLKNCPDLVPIMSVLALFAKGKTRLCDIHHARVKESDRISDLRKELLKVGAKVDETENELIIEPVEKYKSNKVLDPHHDHRLAMAFSVLGLKIGVIVKDIECSHKSYPGFVQDLKALGAKLRKQSD